MTTEKTTISAEIRALADKIKPNLTVEDGKIKPEGNLHREFIPEDLTEAQIKAVNAYQEDYIAAFSTAAGELSVDAMKKDKSLESVEAQCRMIGGTYKGTFHRCYESTQPGTDRKVSTPGKLIASYKSSAAKTQTGELANVSKYLTELAASALK